MKKIFVFDIDDTMYDQQHAFGRALNNLVINEKQLNIPTLYQLMKEYGDEAFSEGFDNKKLKAMQISRIQRALQDYNIQITEEQAIQFQLDFEDYQNDIQLFPKMEELLDLLVNEQQIIGIITNGTIKKQSQKITMLNLDKWFPQNRIFISEKVGISKPEKFIFEQFEKKLDFPINKQHFYYIGDNYQNDIVGPKSVGWHTIWVNYRGYKEEKESLSDYIAYSPDELLSVVQRLVYK